jgi:acetyltransferase
MIDKPPSASTVLSCLHPSSAASLKAMFDPRQVALIGATDRSGSVGRALLENLRGFPGVLYPVNPKRGEVLGLPVYASLDAINGDVDLAVIVTPSASVPMLIRECVAKGVRAVVIISAGFKEAGAEGAALEQQIMVEARRNGLRIIGPNCLGIMAPHLGLNATFATAMARPGGVAFLSQSGALCTAILDWSFAQHVGFSAFVSVGSMVDVGWGDLIRHFGDDPHTSSIVIYMESVGDAARFMEAAREVAAKKPIVVIKVGRTAAAARAAASHTGAMTGSDDVLDAAFRRAGVLRVDTIEELFDMAEVLSKQPLPHGPRLAIVTNAGGPGALATDAIVRSGGTLAELSATTLQQLDALLPSHWSHANPVDILGDADAARFAVAFQAAADDLQVDGLLAVLTPQSMTQSDASAMALIAVAQQTHKPVLASWMGGGAVLSARDRLNCAGLPTYDYPDEAARAFQFMWMRHQRLQLLEETNRLACQPRVSLPAVRELMDAAIAAGRTLLSEFEAKQLLAAAGIPVVQTLQVSTEVAAVAAAESLGYPVVLKLFSNSITHKTDVGGVLLNLRDATAVREAWRQIRAAVPAEAFDGVSVQRMVQQRGVELIVGSITDAQFGPILLFGMGGTMVEVFQDRALALPPLSPPLVEDWIRQTKIYRALQGIRGQPPVDLISLTVALVALADLVMAAPEIAELDINPLLASPEGVVAMDARVVLSKAGVG